MTASDENVHLVGSFSGKLSSGFLEIQSAGKKDLFVLTLSKTGDLLDLQAIGGVDDDSLKAMDELVDEGITSFKLFKAYPGVFYSDDGQVLRAMQTAANNGATIMMHAENGIAIDVLVQQALAAGNTDPRFHGLTRPWETEAEATNRAIKLAKSPKVIEKKLIAGAAHPCQKIK